MYKYTFVILHYETIEVTRLCVESILNNCGEQCSIIIVDNGSKNNTGKCLQREYLGNDSVHVIINENNMGFARGNNEGYRYAKHVLKSDFIILVNSDTQVIQKNFLPIIEEKYEQTNFAVMGPKIIKDGVATNENPRREELFKPFRIRLFICLNQIQYILSYIGIDGFLDVLFKNYVQMRRKHISTGNDNLVCKENVGLHGCCLIFSPQYIKNFDGLNERTFMYLEEEILQYEVSMKGLKLLYCPELEIEHAEAYTTSKMHKSSAQKRRFVYKNSVQSAKVLLDLWEEKRKVQ